jgi:hypothetical protein
MLPLRNGGYGVRADIRYDDLGVRDVPLDDAGCPALTRPQFEDPFRIAEGILMPGQTIDEDGRVSSLIDNVFDRVAFGTFLDCIPPKADLDVFLFPKVHFGVGALFVKPIHLSVQSSAKLSRL